MRSASLSRLTDKVKPKRKRISDRRSAPEREYDNSPSGARVWRQRRRQMSFPERKRFRRQIRRLLVKIKRKRHGRELSREVLYPEPKVDKRERVNVSEWSLIASICRESFFEFVKEFWDIIIPEKPSWNWHIEFLCNELQNLAERIFLHLPKLHDLVVNIPPGTTKSTIISVMFPAWCWTRMLSFRFIGASHSEQLALDLSMKSRDIVLCDKYRACFPEVKLRDDQNTKHYFKTTKNGYRYAVGTNGSVIGMHAHFIAIDDPLDPLKAQSVADLKTCNYWIDSQLSTRKVDKKVSVMCLVMQRLHQDDPTVLFLKRRRIRHICLPAEEALNIRPSELKDQYINGLLDPGRMDYEVLQEEKQKGEYYYCTPGFTPILMSNWKEKRIEDVQIGDEIVGYVSGTGSKAVTGKRTRAKIVKAIVTAKSTSFRKVVKIIMDSGREIYCTPDHKWWVRPSEPNRGAHYRKARKRKGKLGSRLYSVYDPIPFLTWKEQRIMDWLGGIIDGEGACKYGNVQIHKSKEMNLSIHQEIGRVLDKLGIDYSMVKGSSGCEDCYVLKGGRSLKTRLINSAKMVKRKQIADTIWKSCSYVGEKRERVVKIEDAGKMKVYGLTTTTGNYVAWGYASENSSQFRQDPVPPSGGMFKTKRIKIGRVPKNFKMMVRFWDKAGTAAGGNWTVGTLMGIDYDDRIWVLDVKRFQLDSAEREKVIKKTAFDDGMQVRVGVEQEPGSGGKESAENTATKTLRGYKVTVVKVDKSTGGKEERADPWSVAMNNGNVYLPEFLQDQNEHWTGWAEEWIEEHRYFPHSKFKDQVDSASLAFSLINRPRIRIGGWNASKKYAQAA